MISTMEIANKMFSTMETRNRVVSSVTDPILNETYKVHAAGVMLYKNVGTPKILIQNRLKYFEDIGGRTSDEDSDIYDTAIREIKEESNNIISIDKDRLKGAKYIYCSHAKYMLFLLKANEIEKKIYI